jgi:hypothetical protein
MSTSDATGSPSLLRIVDLIPESDSRDVDQNSEPSIAVNPVDPMQMFAGAFDFNNNGASPFFVSTDGGATWSIFGTLDHDDKSIAWKADGSAVLVAALIGSTIDTYSATVTDSGFGAAINHYVGSNDNDQPWIRTGPSNHVYVGFNDDGASAGKNASINVSTNGGSTYTTVTVDRVGSANGDSPATRIAVNGSRVYAIFNRYGSVVESDANGERFNSEIVVVRSDNGGADDFMALGTGGNGVTIATPVSIFTDDENTHLTLGQERIGSDIAIAVDPNNANHVVVVYGDAPGPDDANLVQLVVTESTDGGTTWNQKFTTSSAIRSALPGLAILPNGAIGLLCASYDPTTNELSEHLVTTTNATTTDVTLASQTNSLPTANGDDPYIGDFFDLTGIGNTFYGIFSASNADDGTNASLMNVTFNRRFTGTPGTSSFQLIDATGNAIPFSIDPFFFSYLILNPPPPAATTANMVLRNTGNGTYEIYNLGNNSVLAAAWLGQVGTDWAFVTLGGFCGSDTSDMMLRNSTTGAFQVYDVSNNNITGSAALGTVGLNWQVAGFGNFSSRGETDMMLRNANTGGFQVYDIANNQITGTAFMGTVGLDWQVGGFGNFSSRGTSDMMLRNTTSGGLQVYDIDSNQITGTAFMGTIGLEWQFSGFGNFSSGAGATDMIMRNANTGTLLLYDIANNQITGAAVLGTVGLDWQFAGVAPIHAPGASDLILRNANTGQFEVYDIANNQIIGAASLGQVGLDWQLGGFAASAPTASMGSSGNSPASTSQLVQAMAGFGGGSAGESLNTAPLAADTSQQPLLTTPQHA